MLPFVAILLPSVVTMLPLMVLALPFIAAIGSVRVAMLLVMGGRGGRASSLKLRSSSWLMLPFMPPGF